MDNVLEIEFFTGSSQEGIREGCQIIFAQGSYVPQALPPEQEYVYLRIHNRALPACRPDALWLETCDGYCIDNLHIDPDLLRSRTLSSGTSLTLGILRDLLTRQLRDEFFLPSPLRLRAWCRMDKGNKAHSAWLTLPLDYPRSPLQDAELIPYASFFQHWRDRFIKERERIRTSFGSLRAYANLHHWLGMHRAMENGVPVWHFREWMPAATLLWLTTSRLKFQRWARYTFQRTSAAGLWELTIPADELQHGDYLELRVLPALPGTPPQRGQRRIPAFAKRVEQDASTPEQWCARVWDPPSPYVFCHDACPRSLRFPRIYEAHVGMAQPSGSDSASHWGTYRDFAARLLPRIRENGYTAVQLMAIPSHPLYKSFGYQVSNYFAPDFRFGTPEDFKFLVDSAHQLGLAVILDLPHSHACPNTEQGIARYDTSSYFFAEKNNQWGTPSFDFSKEMTLRFLLSNCRYWLEEYHVDGIRFDAVGNIIYYDNGCNDNFQHVERCFSTAEGASRIDADGILYLQLANTLIHELAPHALTIAEEFSGIPGITSAPSAGGLGFDARLGMGIPDFWGKFIQHPDTMGAVWHELTRHRRYDRTISYVSCHDQCINGDDAMLWRLAGDNLYTHMAWNDDFLPVTRAVALYKLMRLITLLTADAGYLNFMGDEFGHPEWLDAAAYAHRQWHLANDKNLKYAGLAAFDRDCLLRLAAAFPEDFETTPRLRLLEESSRLLAFQRGSLLCCCNFHEQQSAVDLAVWTTPGSYAELLSSDNLRYAGHGNLRQSDPPVLHYTDAMSGRFDQCLRIYLPALSALVLRRQD